jgi:hypothetical protein
VTAETRLVPDCERPVGDHAGFVAEVAMGIALDPAMPGPMRMEALVYFVSAQMKIREGAAEAISRCYFEVAAEVLGEDEVRRRFSERFLLVKQKMIMEQAAARKKGG